MNVVQLVIPPKQERETIGDASVVYTWKPEADEWDITIEWTKAYTMHETAKTLDKAKKLARQRLKMLD